MADLTKSLRVLVVDDEPYVCSAMRRAINAWAKARGLPPIAADLYFDGADGFNAFLVAGEEGEFYDLVVSDTNMLRMGGIEMLEKMRVAGSKVHFVLMSGANEDGEASKAAVTYAATFIDKPFETGHLRDILNGFFPPAPEPTVTLVPETPPRHVLIVHDVDANSDVIVRHLETGFGLQITAHSVCDAEEGLAYLRAHPETDAVIAANGMRGRSGLEFLMDLRKGGNKVPFALTSTRGSEFLTDAARDSDAEVFVWPVDWMVWAKWLREKLSL